MLVLRLLQGRPYLFLTADGYMMVIEMPQLLTCYPAKSRIFVRRPEVKVFWFFSSEKNKILLFLKKKKQKDFCFPASRSKIRDLAG